MLIPLRTSRLLPDVSCVIVKSKSTENVPFLDLPSELTSTCIIVIIANAG